MRLNIVITYERLTLNSKLKIFELETRNLRTRNLNSS